MALTLNIPMPTLQFAVNGVVLIGSDPQMLGIHTGRVVTSVQAFQMLRNGSELDVVGHPVSEEQPAFDASSPVSILDAAPSPEPTSVRVGGFVNLSPKSGNLFLRKLDFRKRRSDHLLRFIHDTMGEFKRLGCCYKRQSSFVI